MPSTPPQPLELARALKAADPDRYLTVVAAPPAPDRLAPLLGLYLVNAELARTGEVAREVIGAMRGRLDVESREGLGSRFIVYVPLAAATVRALGVNGVSPVGSGPDGAYSMRVPQNGSVILAASKPEYLQSYEQVEVGGTDINGKNFLMAYNEHITRLAERFGRGR